MGEFASLDEIRRFMEGVTFPITKRTLLETAREAGESEGILRTIEALPDDEYRDHLGLHADMEAVARSG